VFILQNQQVGQCFATGLWLSLGIPVSSTNKTDHHDITEILLEVALKTIIINQSHPPSNHIAFKEKSVMLNLNYEKNHTIN
jgi:hypothetical protein